MDELFGSILEGTTTLTIATAAAILTSVIVLGFGLALIYHFSQRKEGYAPSFLVSLVILPLVVAVIIYLVGSNTARAISLAGIFAIARFRSEQKNFKDLTYIFFAVTIGLACGLGYIGYGAIATIVFALVILIINVTHFGSVSSNDLKLSIVVPENLNYESLFDDILNQYCETWSMHKVKTIDFGTMFQVSYYLVMKKNVSQKKMFDELRSRNGNLNITLTLRKYESE